MQELLWSQQRSLQKRMVGREVSVLFEKAGRDAGQMVGKSEHLHAVHAYAPDVAIGELRQVRIVESLTNSLTGELL